MLALFWRTAQPRVQPRLPARMRSSSDRASSREEERLIQGTVASDGAGAGAASDPGDDMGTSRALKYSYHADTSADEDDGGSRGRRAAMALEEASTWDVESLLVVVSSTSLFLVSLFLILPAIQFLQGEDYLLIAATAVVAGAIILFAGLQWWLVLPRPSARTALTGAETCGLIALVAVATCALAVFGFAIVDATEVYRVDFSSVPSPSSDVVRGALPHGMQYSLMQHNRPAGRFTLAVRLSVGSMEEEPTQRGLAHLAEHGAVDRSTDHASRYGVWEAVRRSGASLNAFTTYRSTVFTLTDNPATAEGMRSALELARSIAMRADPQNDLLDREKGVVIGEFRMRNGSKLIAESEALCLHFGANSRACRRQPLGEEATVRDATAADLIDWYEGWFHASRAAIYAAGDVDPEALEAVVRQVFADGAHPRGKDLKPRPRVDPADSWRKAVVSQANPVRVAVVPGVDGVEVHLSATDPDGYIAEPLTRRQRLRRVAESLFRPLLRHMAYEAATEAYPVASGLDFPNLRIEADVTNDYALGARLHTAVVSSGAGAGGAAVATGDPEHTTWRQDLEMVLTELRRLAMHGPHPDLLSHVRKLYRQRLDELELTELAGADGEAVVERLYGDLDPGYAFLSARDETEADAVFLAPGASDALASAVQAEAAFMWQAATMCANATLPLPEAGDRSIRRPRHASLLTVHGAASQRTEAEELAYDVPHITPAAVARTVSSVLGKYLEQRVPTSTFPQVDSDFGIGQATAPANATHAHAHALLGGARQRRWLHPRSSVQHCTAASPHRARAAAAGGEGAPAALRHSGAHTDYVRAVAAAAAESAAAGEDGADDSGSGEGSDMGSDDSGDSGDSGDGSEVPDDDLSGTPVTDVEQGLLQGSLADKEGLPQSGNLLDMRRLVSVSHRLQKALGKAYPVLLDSDEPSGVRRYELANGIRVNLKPRESGTAKLPNSPAGEAVMQVVSLGGRATEHGGVIGGCDLVNTAQAAGYGVQYADTGRPLDSAEYDARMVRRALGTVKAELRCEEEFAVVDVQLSEQCKGDLEQSPTAVDECDLKKQDFVTALELARLFTRPLIDARTLHSAKEKRDSEFRAANRTQSPRTALRLNGVHRVLQDSVFDEDRRMRVPSVGRLARLDPLRVSAWVREQFAPDRMEVNVAGDFDEDALIQQMSVILGTIPVFNTSRHTRRLGWDVYSEDHAREFSRTAKNTEVATRRCYAESAVPRRAYVEMFVPAAGGPSGRGTQLLRVSDALASEALFDALRKEGGFSYGVDVVESLHSVVFPTWGYHLVQWAPGPYRAPDGDPLNVDASLSAARNALRNVPDALVDRVLVETRAAAEVELQEPAKWLKVMRGLSLRVPFAVRSAMGEAAPETLKDIAQMDVTGSLKAIKRDQVKSFFSNHIRPFIDNGQAINAVVETVQKLTDKGPLLPGSVACDFVF